MKMKCASLVFAFAVLALLAGLVSAWHWFKSASGHPMPEALSSFAGAPGESPMSVWMKDTAERNRKAAGWAAASVVMGAISNIIGALS
jgi:hypothetical protein